MSSDVRGQIEAIYQTESRRVFATLIRILGDFELAEEGLHDAFAQALTQWSDQGIPENPRAWLVSTAKFKAIDGVRRRARHERAVVELSAKLEARSQAHRPEPNVPDDQLRLIFTCCHPALAPEVQVALTLREVCGLTTEEIAGAFLVSVTTLAQRLVRAKAKIRDAGIPYEIPERDELPERLDAVLQVIYLVFNEGYSATTGNALTRSDLMQEAIRLGRLLYTLLPETEVMGLLALMLLHDARRDARTGRNGELILLEDQDRSLWNREQIAEGSQLVELALRSKRFGPYSIQAAIAALHAEAASSATTDWTQIVELYSVLLRIQPSPIIELNRAVAIAMRDGLDVGLTEVNAILERGDLQNYHLAFATRGELYRRLGQMEAARVDLEKALTLSRQEPERHLLRTRLGTLSSH